MKEKQNSQQIGIINEIGDLGLGFYPIQESDQEKIKKSEKGDKEE